MRNKNNQGSFKTAGDKKSNNYTNLRGTTKFKTKCKVCIKENHITDNCFVLKRVKNYLKDNHNDSKINFLAHVLEDPYDEFILPIREGIAQEIDWSQCKVEEEDLEEIITAVLQLPETYESFEEESY